MFASHDCTFDNSSFPMRERALLPHESEHKWDEEMSDDSDVDDQSTGNTEKVFDCAREGAGEKVDDAYIPIVEDISTLSQPRRSARIAEKKLAAMINKSDKQHLQKVEEEKGSKIKEYAAILEKEGAMALSFKIKDDMEKQRLLLSKREKVIAKIMKRDSPLIKQSATVTNKPIPDPRNDVEAFGGAWADEWRKADEQEISKLLR